MYTRVKDSSTTGEAPPGHLVVEGRTTDVADPTDFISGTIPQHHLALRSKAHSIPVHGYVMQVWILFSRINLYLPLHEKGINIIRE